jgi:enoyl-[acyl-carrier protein] reductase I
MTDASFRPVLAGQKALVIGVANEESIAYGCAKAFRTTGAELAMSWLNEKARRHVEPLARELEASIVGEVDVTVTGQLEAMFDQIRSKWGRLDILVHSIAFAPKADLQGGILNCSAEGFAKDGRFVPFLRSHGEARGAADDQRRDDVRDELLRREPRWCRTTMSWAR